MKPTYAIAALALMAVSCNQGNDLSLSDSRAMLFQVTSHNAATKVAEGAFEEGDRVGLFVVDYVDETTPAPLQISGNRANNEPMTLDEGQWRTGRTLYWGEGKSDVYAYYPYWETLAEVDAQPFSVATDQTTAEAVEASDLLWAKAEGVAQADGAVSLEMKHVLSRLVVRIMAGEDYIGSLPAAATVHLHSTVTDALVSLSNGSVEKDPYSGARSIQMRNCGVRNYADGQAVVYEAIVVPQMLASSVPLLEINSKSVSYLLEDAFNFKPGVSYTYTAVLNASTEAIKIEIGCEIEDWNNLGGDEGGSEGGEGGAGGDDGIDLSLYTDLSAAGTANCYLIQAAGNYKFKAVMGNSDATVGNVKKTEVLWESFGTDVMPNVGDLIASAGYKNGYVYFSTPETFANGNASIAVRNSKDVILWSWHIWCAEEGWIDQVYANEAGTMMDRNLGATSATPGDIGAFGLLYQWGRKDPFLGSCSDSGTTLAASTGNWSVVSAHKTIVWAEENPTSFITGSEWCTGVGSGTSPEGYRWKEDEKTLYDPCPVGYRVPDGGAEGFWATAYVATLGEGSDKGRYWELADGTHAWYPAVGGQNYNSGALYNVGFSGNCWSASPIPDSSIYAYDLYFIINGNVKPASDGFRGGGYSVRCVRE